MVKLSLRSLLTHKLRTAMAILAVVLGTGFVSGTFVFSDALSRVLDSAVEGSATDLAITPKPPVDTGGFPGSADVTVAQADVDKVAAVPGVARAAGTVTVIGTYLLDGDGKVAGNVNAPSFGYAWTGLGATAALSQGSAPEGGDQVVLDRKTAEKAGVRVGGTATLLLPSGDQRQATVSGLYVPPGSDLGGGGAVAFAPQTAQQLLPRPGTWSGIEVALRPGADADEVKRAVATALGDGFEVSTRADQIKEAKDALGSVVNVFTYVLLGFALVSLLVGGFLIANTFTMIVAQRSREMALLRAIGAKRRQVTRALLLEALVIGLVGAVVGMFLGLGIALGLAELLGTTGLNLSFTPRLPVSAVVAALLVGIVVTVVSAYLPTRRAGRIAPVEALRESVSVPDRPRRRRTVLGVVVLVLAVAAFVLSNAAEDTGPKALWTGIGALLLITAAVALAPRLAMALVGVLPRTRRASVRLARANTVRNPRRTAATAAALMIGLALVTGVTVVASSITASIGKVVDDDDVKIDYAVSAAFTQVEPALQAKIEAVPGVGQALLQQSFQADAGGSTVGATANGGADLSAAFAVERRDGTVDAVAPGTFIVDEQTAEERGWALGQQVPFTYVTGTQQTLRLAGIYKPTALIDGIQANRDDYRAATGDDSANVVFVMGEPGTDQSALRSGLEAATAGNPLMQVQSVDDVKEQAGSQVNTLLSLVYGLLVLSVVIAVLGVINTMAMSVLERTREIGLLRAVGLTRRQSRSMIRRESVLISLLGALLGIASGLVIGVFLQRALAPTGIEELAIPWLNLAVFFVLAAVIGVVAALAPARRAARMDVLGAIATS